MVWDPLVRAPLVWSPQVCALQFRFSSLGTPGLDTPCLGTISLDAPRLGTPRLFDTKAPLPCPNY